MHCYLKVKSTTKEKTLQGNETSSASNNRELQHAFLKFVETIEDGSFGLHTSVGICSNFWRYCLNWEADVFLKQIFPLWEKFSGEVSFPIKGGEKMYLSSLYAGTLWDKSQEYGKLRWELLYFIRDYCYTQITNKGETKWSISKTCMVK